MWGGFPIRRQLGAVFRPSREGISGFDQALSPCLTELEIAKAILAEVFETSLSDVEEMIRERLSEDEVEGSFAEVMRQR